MKNITDLMECLGIFKYPERWKDIYCEAIREYENQGAYFADEKYITKLNDSFNLFDNYIKIILEAAHKLRDNPPLMQYIYLLSYAMGDRNAFRNEIKDITPPKAPENTDSLAYDFLLLFAVLRFIPISVQIMQKRGVPENVIFDTMKGYEQCIDLTYDIYGKPGLSFKRYLSWIQLYIDVEILKIGCLNFNVCKHFNGCVYVLKNQSGQTKILMHKVRLHKGGMVYGSSGYMDEDLAFDAQFCETDAYFEGYPVLDTGLIEENRICFYKPEWKIVLSFEDPVIGVHIPSVRHGGRLKEETCDLSYKDARRIFSSCYPEYAFKAFSCNSWLLDSQLERFLPKESGIIKFQKKYLFYPRESTGNAVFSFVFLKPVLNLSDLPEDTRLQRAIKKHYLKGKFIYEQGGVIIL